MYELSNGEPSFDSAPLDRSAALLRWGSFWAAIGLPLIHVPLLVANGLTSTSIHVLLALWVANAVALVIGRRHSPHGRPGVPEEGRR